MKTGAPFRIRGFTPLEKLKRSDSENPSSSHDHGRIPRPRSSLRSLTGFTLIEMMIVVVVIAILIGVLLPNFRGTQDEALVQRAKAELRTLATGVESYYIHNSNTLPANLSAMTSATPLVINRVPNDPFNGSTAYQYSTAGAYYIIWSYGIGRTATITGVNSSGVLQGSAGDDICVTNGTSTAC